MRIDTYLAENGIAPSRTRATDMIKKGLVKVDGRVVAKPSFEIGEGQKVSVDRSEHEYVSRAAHKLAFAKECFGISFDGLCAADLGASTGGFCQVMLEDNIKKLWAIDIGHGQLHPDVAKDKRVCVLEGVNARYITEETLGQKVDIVTSDLSFISQTLVFEAICKILKPDGIYIGLIKPQFEAGRENIGKGGIVKDKKIHERVIEKVIGSANSFGLVCTGITASPILGGDGNREFLACYVKREKPGDIPTRDKIQSVVREE
ncbi:MAG: TlyA family RNA methyltransferase [Clostridia bacterium]|nr:TlyA family RNA methyltransferase [Clostridia bacterium]